MNYNPMIARAESRPPRFAPAGPPPRTAEAGAATLARLKNRLLRETLAACPAEPFASLLRLAATEAEAQAWLSTFPLLTFPVLFEEKEREVRDYFARQERLRSKPT